MNPRLSPIRSTSNFMQKGESLMERKVEVKSIDINIHFFKEWS